MKLIRPLLWLQIFCTLCLITLGGVVHNTGSSLACPDWPLCFGMVMPPMEGQVAIEHSHRLLGALVGFFSVLIVAISLKNRRQISSTFFKLSLVSLGLVIFQGVLGGVTVLLKLSPLVSTAHLVTSQIFLANLLLLHFASSPKYSLSLSQWRGFDHLRFLPFVLIFCIFQMGLGAFIRHGGAALACGLGPESMFLCRSHEDFSLVWWPTLGPAQANMLHRYAGVLLAFLVVLGTLPTLKWAKKNNFKNIRRLVASLHALVAFQIVLGLWTLASGIHPVIVTLHLVGGVGLWLLLWTLWGQTLQISYSQTRMASETRVKTSSGSKESLNFVTDLST